MKLYLLIQSVICCAAELSDSLFSSDLVLLDILVNLMGLLKGLFELYSNFVFVEIDGEYPFWKLAFRN